MRQMLAISREKEPLFTIHPKLLIYYAHVVM